MKLCELINAGLAEIEEEMDSKGLAYIRAKRE